MSVVFSPELVDFVIKLKAKQVHDSHLKYMYVIVSPPLCLTYYLSCSLDEICLAFPVLYLDIVGVFFIYFSFSLLSPKEPFTLPL